MNRYAVLMVLAATLSGPLPAAPGLEAGVAAVDITPAGGKVFDPLYAKAVVFQQGAATGALVICDIPVINAQQSREARALASKRTGIPAANISIAATHTHSGDPHAELAVKIAEAVAQAQSRLQPTTLRSGAAQQLEPISFHRRFLLKDGTVRFNPGIDAAGRSFDGGYPFLHPDIVRPVGPIDPEVNVVLLETGDHGATGSITSFALHACTCPHQKFSADYPHFLEEKLREAYGPRFISLFGAGACGDINHWDASKPGPQMGWEEMSRPIGTKLGATVLSAAMRPAEAAFAVRSAVVDVPLQQHSQADLEWARRAIAGNFDGFGGVGYGERGFLAGVRARKIVRLAERRASGAVWPLAVHVFRLANDTAIVTLPGELFVELGLAIRKASPFRNTLIVELANEDIHYVPTAKAFIEGGYEVVNSMLAPGGGEMLVDTAVSLLNGLHPHRAITAK